MAAALVTASGKNSARADAAERLMRLNEDPRRTGNRARSTWQQPHPSTGKTYIDSHRPRRLQFHSGFTLDDAIFPGAGLPGTFADQP